MAKVVEEQLSWLSKPSTGYDLFSTPSTFTPSTPSDSTSGVSPKRLIATRGSEIFVGRGNKVRCADLQDLKARHPGLDVVAEEAKKVGHREYKALNIPQIDFEIRQLEISQDDLYLAIVGEKEVAVCVLPGEGFLKRDAARPVVPHFHRIGRGHHNVDTGARIVRVLWHPLSVEGASLIVLTADGYVRTYDFLIGNDLSFEVPDQSLDLYALGGRKRHVGGFAADSDEMEPAACCFGSGEQSWRPLTLYILMRSGDMYSLSPIVPSRWDAPQGYIQRLSLEITAEQSFDEQTTPEAKVTNRHQTKWINDVLNQRQNIVNAQTSFDTPKGLTPTCLMRPTVVGPTPVLQGPFLFEPAPPEPMGDDLPAACDIFHLEVGPIGVIGIIYSNGKLDICLEEEPITAKWIGKKGMKSLETQNLPMISHYETVNLPFNAGEGSKHSSWPTFTRDPHSAQMLFVNSIIGVTLFSMKGWLSKLEAVLDDQEDDDFLVKTLQKAPRTQIQEICATPGFPVEGCTVLYEAYIGYIIIAKLPDGFSSKAFDEPDSFLPFEDSNDTITLQPSSRRFAEYTETSFNSSRFGQSESSFSMSTKSQSQRKSAPPIPVPQPLNILQPPYKPSPKFTKPSNLPGFLHSISRDAKKPIVFTAETLRHLENARDTLSTEFSALMTGAQEMYDRAAAQRLEYSKQLEALHNIHARLSTIKTRNVSERVEAFITRQEEMQKRADALLKRLITESEVGLSDAEKKWAKEVDRISERVAGGDGLGALGSRTLRVGDLVEDLVVAADEAVDSESVHDPVPAEIREGKLGMLMGLLEREGVLVESTRKKLEALIIECDRP